MEHQFDFLPKLPISAAAENVIISSPVAKKARNPALTFALSPAKDDHIDKVDIASNEIISSPGAKKARKKPPALTLSLIKDDQSDPKKESIKKADKIATMLVNRNMMLLDGSSARITIREYGLLRPESSQ